ncbi:MAG: response regulator transcription factor [Streptococcaceae bacterium]|jgi:DNA-binding response OmpR family regulator|nr:response regulator transcription factor [Streptococcaceae bacterium]
MYKILAIDDDEEILKLLRTVLEMKNYQVTTRQKVFLPLRISDFEAFDLILLDIMMPNVDGREICRSIRKQISTPIIFVSAKDQENEIIEGLTIGGDDYITKPFSIRQLSAKVEAHLRREERSKRAVQEFEQPLRHLGPVTFYLENRQVYINGQLVALTSREYDILELLSRRPNKIYSREEIYDKVYSQEANALFRSISEYVYQIRVKFSIYDFSPIKTVRTLGYQWHD